jgi:hypothetical protein
MAGGDSNIATTSVSGTLTFGATNTASGNLNIDDNGTKIPASGAFSISGPDAYGRILIPQDPSGYEIGLVGYVTSSTEIQLQETQGDVFQGVLEGFAVK